MIPVIYMDLIDDAESLIEFEEIYHTYRKRMFYVANTVLQDTHEAEDAVQDAFIGIARNISTVRKIREAEDLGNYVLRAAKNAALNRSRTAKECASVADVDKLPNVSDDSFWETVSSKVLYDDLVRAIADMPELYREALYHHYVLEFSVKETAETLQLKPAAVKQRLVRGKKLLLKALGQPEEDGNE